MIRKFLVLPAILSLACVLLVTDVAQAQRRGGFGRGGFGVYVGPTYGGYYGSRYYSPYGYNNSYRSGYYSPFGSNGYYGSGYYSPNWSNSYPSTSYYYSPPIEYTQPAPMITGTANIRVLLPDPQARVWFDGVLTNQQGSDRLFTTPNFTSSGAYRIRAAWMQGANEVTREQTVNVSPGQDVVVDFTR